MYEILVMIIALPRPMHMAKEAYSYGKRGLLTLNDVIKELRHMCMYYSGEAVQKVPYQDDVMCMYSTEDVICMYVYA